MRASISTTAFLTIRSISHVLSAIMRVDETCRQFIYQLAASTPDVSEIVLGSDAERIMEQRLDMFRKTVRASSHAL